METIKTRNTKESISLPKKWQVIEDYLACKLSNNDIAEKYQLHPKTVDEIIGSLYKKLQNIRETKALIATQKRPDVFLQIKKDYIDSDRINQEFLDLLSEPDSLVLTDNELIFSELFVNNGDEISSLEESGLSVGLKKADRTSYLNSCKLRAFYLRRKSNIATTIRDIQRSKISLMENGKEHLQGELLAVVEKLRNNGDPRSVPSILKAIELLGRSVGAFEEKITIETVNGDDVLDSILSKAKRAQVIELDNEET